MAMAAKIALPDDERGQSDAAIRRFDKLLRKRALPTLTDKQREALAAELAAIEQAPANAAEQSSLDRHLALLTALEAGRDPHTPPERDRLGRLHIRSRDGLATLLEAGALTPMQFAAGMRYRALYEATEASIRSNLNRDISGEGDGRTLSAIGQKAQARKRIEIRVQGASRNGRGLTALRLVAGQGRTIYSFGTGGSDKTLYRDALVVALEVVADHFGMRA